MTVRQARSTNGHQEMDAAQMEELTKAPPPEGRRFSLRGLLVPVAVIIAGLVILRRLQDADEV